ncbi:hypothetical protein [Anaeromicropila populeti]|uniref:Uncharacterized protein n=1 Tax=Anaeromicropila populeti TaxID=37658 RepID=A0A1I6KT48_9FIRM|nr:hypothetical protein [Anaeromicropila populeti]SFR94198.1 hypothetical protein SAMN05661086_02664 [Anaeromicropila populeti]
MNKGNNALYSFLGGLAMLVVGLYFFMNKVTVTSYFFQGVRFGRFDVAGGVIVVPLIIGVVIVFANPDSIVGKIVCGLGVLLIVASIISTTHLQLNQMTLFEWILYMVLIFGGTGLLARVLFQGSGNKKDKNN